MKKKLTLERHNEFDILTKFNQNSFNRETPNSNLKELVKMPTTKEFLEKKEKNQGIKIFQQELTKSINREDGIYKSPKVKVFELPDSKRVFNKDANYQIYRNTLSPTNIKYTTTNTTKNKTEKNLYSFENLYSSNYNTKDYFSSNNSPAGYVSPSNCDNFNKRNLCQHGFTTQITTIPGGLKRQFDEIKDDKKNMRKTSQSFLYKLSRDFSTKETNEFLNFKEIKQNKLFPARGKPNAINKKESENNNIGTRLNRTDGFHSTSNKYKFSKKMVFSKNVEDKKERSNSKCPRPNNVKNAFESQIVFC